MSEQDVNSDELTVFSQKLDAFAQSLSAKEASLLATILTRAARPEVEDVEGHFFQVGPEIADPALRLAHLYTMVAWYDVQPHLQTLLHHIAAGGHVHPHVLPHLPGQ